MDIEAAVRDSSGLTLVAVQVSLKGARALIKVFTDLQASVEDVQSWFSVGLEPIIGLVRTLSSYNSPSPHSTMLNVKHPLVTKPCTG